MHNLFSKIWNDPVWSKVIAAGLLFMLSLIIKQVRHFILWIFRKTIHWLPFYSRKVKIDANIENRKSNITKKSKGQLLQEWTYQSDEVFFAERFAFAFPGLRDPKWFYRKEASDRLMLLLKHPLVFKHGQGTVTPIWWWSDGNLHISNCVRKGRTKILLDVYEHDIDRILAAYHRSYHKLFVYVQTKGMKPTGLYKQYRSINSSTADRYHFLREEYGIYNKRHLITRSEYYDGAAKIGRKIINTTGKSELRVRSLTPFIFLIAPNGSPINNNDFDIVLENYLEKIIKSQVTPEELMENIFALERPFSNKD